MVGVGNTSSKSLLVIQQSIGLNWASGDVYPQIDTKRSGLIDDVVWGIPVTEPSPKGVVTLWII